MRQRGPCFSKKWRKVRQIINTHQIFRQKVWGSPLPKAMYQAMTRVHLCNLLRERMKEEWPFDHIASSFYEKSFIIHKRLLNFAAMKETWKRKIASWLLLAVFLPMTAVSSLHIHTLPSGTEEECPACVQHPCHGHWISFSGHAYECVLCQFLSLTYPAATAATGDVIYNYDCKSVPAFKPANDYAACLNVMVCRGPPFAFSA